MARHNLLGLYVSKLAFSKWSHELQHEAHRCMLGCSRKGGGSAKNICIRRISKQKYIKNRRIFSLCSLCLSCNTHDSSGILFCSRKVKKLGTSAEFQGQWMWKVVLLGCLIQRTKSGRAHHTHSSKKECQAKLLSPNYQGNLQLPNLCRFIKAPLNTHSVYRSDLRYPQKESIDNDAPRMPKSQECAMGSRRNPGTYRETRLNQL